MRSLMCDVEGATAILPTSVEDVAHSLDKVEMAYESNNNGGASRNYNI